MSGVTDVLQETIRQLTERRRKLEPFVAELSEIDIAEKDLRKALDKITKRQGATKAVVAEANQTARREAGKTHRERIVAVLREHPAGLSGAKIGDLAEVDGKQIYAVLSGMAMGPNASIDKVGRGFYRLKADSTGEQVEAELSADEIEELGDRAAA